MSILRCPPTEHSRSEDEGNFYTLDPKRTEEQLRQNRVDFFNQPMTRKSANPKESRAYDAVTNQNREAFPRCDDITRQDLVRSSPAVTKNREMGRSASQGGCS